MLMGLGTAPPASAQPYKTRAAQFAVDGDVSSYALAATKADMQRVASYWSPERLKQASSYEPSNRPSPSTTATTSSLEMRPGKASASKASKKTSRRDPGSPPMVGKVFFKLGDKEYWCSASVVHSKYKNLVATAGHCAFALIQGKPVEDWIFIPSYDNGKTDAGIFVGHTLYLNEDFAGKGLFDRDYAFVTVYRGFTWQAYSEAGQVKYRPVDVGRLEDKVGAFQFASNKGTGRKVFVFGYPAGANPDGTRPFTGQTVKSCFGLTEKRSVSAPAWQLAHGVRLPRCGFTSGASGGPWVIGYDRAKRTGSINGVTSLTWNVNGDGLLDAVSTPYFNALTRRVYQQAAKQPTG